MIVKEQKEICFINSCNCICDYDVLKKALLWYTDKPIISVKKIYLHVGRPAVSIYYKKIHVHRLIMMYLLNDKNINNLMYVHHKDGDVLNNETNNLELITAQDHIILHLKNKKQNQYKAMIRVNKMCLSRYGHETLKYKNYQEANHDR